MMNNNSHVYLCTVLVSKDVSVALHETRWWSYRPERVAVLCDSTAGDSTARDCEERAWPTTVPSCITATAMIGVSSIAALPLTLQLFTNCRFPVFSRA